MACLLSVLLWPLCGRVAAQPALRLRTVVVTSEDGPPLDEALLAALRELFTRVGLTLVETDEGKDEGLLARVRIQRDVDAATVRVFSVTGKRLASTHRVPRAETDALFRETLAHVVLGAVEPLAVERRTDEANAPAVAQPEATPAVETAGESAAPAPKSLHFGGALGAGPVLLEDLWGARVFGRADAYLGTRVASVFGLTLGGVLPRERERANVESKLAIAFARVHAGVEPWISRIARLGLLLSFGIDLMKVSVHPLTMAEVDSRELYPSPMLGALAQLRFPLRRGVELQTTLGCDLDLKPRKFTAGPEQAPTTLFAPAFARPYAALAVGWSSL